MGVRVKNTTSITIAVAIVDKFVKGLDDYINKIDSVKELILKQKWIKSNYELKINTADSYERESIYLTVTGSSVENGDDGQVGRGNRANGLITPNRSMTLEAVAGKNPISHVGKIYNLFASNLSKSIVENGFGSEARVNIVSQIGKPINQPQILDIGIKEKSVKESVITDLAGEMLQNLPFLWKDIIKGKFEIA